MRRRPKAEGQAALFDDAELSTQITVVYQTVVFTPPAPKPEAAPEVLSAIVLATVEDAGELKWRHKDYLVPCSRWRDYRWTETTAAPPRYRTLGDHVRSLPASAGPWRDRPDYWTIVRETSARLQEFEPGELGDIEATPLYLETLNEMNAALRALRRMK